MQLMPNLKNTKHLYRDSKYAYCGNSGETLFTFETVRDVKDVTCSSCKSAYEAKLLRQNHD